MALFVKFYEESDENLIDLYNSCVTILRFYYNYFDALGIPLSEVSSYGRPEYFNSVRELYLEVTRVLTKRGILKKEE